MNEAFNLDQQEPAPLKVCQSCQTVYQSWSDISLKTNLWRLTGRIFFGSSVSATPL